ncbi:MAG: D-alanine--D-alanine ligase [Verrucomicrobiota bacterium]
MTGKFKRVAVLMGGFSSEREVSLSSGAAVSRGLGEAGYEVETVDVVDANPQLPSEAEAVFIALHGAFGEDGGIQKVLDRAGIPYTGSGAQASSAAFNKELSKKIFSENGIPSASYEVLGPGDSRSLPFPVVVKPVAQGSSLGVSRVFDEAGWKAAVSRAFSYGDRILVEKYIKGKELTVGVVGKKSLPLIEIVAPEEWYDYNAKYTKGITRYLEPATVERDIAGRCRDLALKAFQCMGCRGFGRVDFRMGVDGSLYVLEINTIPGFTETSLLPKAAVGAGIGFAELCDMIMQSAKCDG